MLIAVGVSLAAYSGLPESMPVHWNLRGEADRYGSRPEALFTIPLVMVALWAILRFLPRIDSLRANYAKFAGSSEVIIDSLLAMMLVIHVAIVLGASGAPEIAMPILAAGVGTVAVVSVIYSYLEWRKEKHSIYS